MTQIVIYQSQNGIKGFTSEGHAGHGVRGNDVVCASVSILLMNTINSIEAFSKEKAEVSVNERKAKIEFWMDHSDHDAELLLRSMKLGIEGIAKEYPGNVTIRIEEV